MSPNVIHIKGPFGTDETLIFNLIQSQTIDINHIFYGLTIFQPRISKSSINLLKNLILIMPNTL